MRPELIAETHPETAPENIIKGDCWRISVLTEGLLRLEYDPDGIFEDRATSPCGTAISQEAPSA